MSMMESFAMGEMKAWLLECFEDEYDQEQIRELTYNECVKAINRYFNGGMQAWKECNGWVMVDV